MRGALILLICFEVILLSWFVGRRILEAHAQRKNLNRKAFLENFVSSLQKPDAEKILEELPIRAVVVGRFLDSSYGRWFSHTCVRAGKWDRAEISKLVGRKFELALGGLIIAVLGVQVLSTSSAVIVILPLLGFFFPLVTSPSILVGVFSNKVKSVSLVRSVDADSWKKKCLDFVSLTFQVRTDLFENQSVRPTSDSTNILPHDISGLNFSDCSEHFGPKMAFIFFSHSFSSGTKRLAWETTGEHVNFSSPKGKVSCLDVVI